MSSRFFDNWLTGYMTWTSASESPDSFHFWSGVSAIAGALRRCVWVDMKLFQWTPNFYIVLVGPAGIAAKSTSTGMAMRLLEQVPEVHFGPTSVTWQALTQSLQESIITVKWINGTGEEQKTPAACVTISASELGTFLKMDQEGFVDVLVDLWDGQIRKRSWTHKTRTQSEIRIENPWINLLGCTTPSWLQNHFPEYMIGGGFTSRILFVFGNTKRQLVALPDEGFGKTGDFEELERKLVADLVSISKLRGPMTITPEGREWMKTWYAKHWGSIPSHMASMRYEGFRARKQTHVVKTAMVLSAARGDSLSITAQHLEEANSLVGSIESSMIRVFESIGSVDEARFIREISSLVRGFAPLHPSGVPVVEVWSRLVNSMSLEDFRRALQGGKEAGIFRIANTGKFDERGKAIVGIFLSEAST